MIRKIWENRLLKFLISGAITALIIFTLPGCLYGLQYYFFAGTMVLLFLIVNLSSFFGKFPLVTTTARIAVGGLFIFSGAIKANDTLGFSYKMEEYFGIFSQGFPCDMSSEESPEGAGDAGKNEGSMMSWLWNFFHEHALALSVIICIAEIILGGMILLGIRVELTLWLLLGMIVFFSLLTFYSACCNQVKTCGCFGDFIKLTPWQSYWKDMVLLVLIALLFAGKENINTPFNPVLQTIAMIIVIAFALWLPWYTYNHLPIFDFRPYQTGTDICKDRQGIADKMKWYYTYKKGNELKELDKQLKEQGWELVSHRTVITEAGKPAPIQDFHIRTREGEEVTDSILNMPGPRFLLISPLLKKADRNEQGQLNDLYTLAKQEGIPFICLTASGEDDIRSFISETNAAYTFYITDETALKTMIRANPGLVLLKGCEVAAMWHNNDLPSYNDVKAKYFK
jgi:hypothetical protein